MASPQQQKLQEERPFSTTVEAVMQKMCLVDPEDAYLLPQLLHWVKTQRPNYMYTTVLSLAVLLQRLARAFSMRSQAALPPKPKLITSSAVSPKAYPPAASTPNGSATATTAAPPVPQAKQRRRHLQVPARLALRVDQSGQFRVRPDVR